MNKQDLKLAGKVAGKIAWEGSKDVLMKLVVGYLLVRIMKGKKETQKISKREWIEKL